MTTHAYLRVSTEAQDEASQRQIIAGWLATHPRHHPVYHTDKASGATRWQDRACASILADCKPGDMILVSEISRIARSVTGVLSFLERAAERGIHVVAVRSGIALDGSLPSKIVVTMLALAAEIERDLIRERTRAALAARRAAGVTLGRPRGSRGVSKCLPHAADIARMMAAKVSQRAIARVIQVSPSTLAAYLSTTRPQDP